MANVTVAGGLIRKCKQVITVNGSTDNDIWCTSVSMSAGIGSVTADFVLPFKYADEIGDTYADKKVIVKAGITSASKVIFVGYLSGKQEDISVSGDSVSLTGYSVGHYLSKIGVGEELNQWNYKYPLFDDLTGEITGWTPAGVLLDLYSRLPERWTDELQLGSIRSITDTYDLPVQNYEFSLSSYQDAIESITSSLGDVAVAERFKGDKCYLDFFRISDSSAPLNTVKVAERDNGDDANVASITPGVASDEIVNCAIAFGRDKEFMVTCKSVVSGLTEQSEPADIVTGLYPTALVKDWDSALEPMVLKDPKLASSDRVNRSLKILGTSPGTVGTTFECEIGIDLIPNKCILTHPASGERMLVTAFTAKVPADPEADPPTDAVNASVTVTREYQGTTAGDLETGKQLTVEVPGISNVFRRYRLPAGLLAEPEKEILDDLPLIDVTTEDRYEAQIFLYRSNLSEDDADTEKKTGGVSTKPTLLKSGSRDFDKHRIHLDKPAVVPVTIQKTTVDGKSRVKATYQETVVGVTLAYIDHYYPFGWNTGQVSSDMDLPWEQHTERVKMEEFMYWRATNTGSPLIDQVGTQIVFNCQFINPRTDVITTGDAVLRDDTVYLRTAAERILMERNRRHVTYGIEIPWLDMGYALGNRLEVQGLDNQPQELLTITQITYNMPENGDHTTSLTVDNVKPPSRKSFNTRFKKAL